MQHAVHKQVTPVAGRALALLFGFRLYQRATDNKITERPDFILRQASHAIRTARRKGQHVRRLVLLSKLLVQFAALLLANNPDGNLALSRSISGACLKSLFQPRMDFRLHRNTIDLTRHLEIDGYASGLTQDGSRQPLLLGSAVAVGLVRFDDPLNQFVPDYIIRRKERKQDTVDITKDIHGVLQAGLLDRKSVV